tara:strand:- start:61 stop:603 length:543 start_codon:yes stop_codon:yes gene_type:complete
MPATPNNSGNMSRRQSFNGKGLTSVEMIFDVDMATTATTPEAKDSAFEICSEIIQEKGTLLAKSYALGCKATERDAADGASITEDELIDTYQFIMEGTPGQLNNADSAGDINLDPNQADSSDPGVIADAEADIETSILARIDENDSAGGVHVTVRYLPADGVTSAGAEAVYGLSNARVNS